MNFDYNENLEPKNFVDGVDFGKDDSCVWNVYPPGAAGDLLASIVNAHYGRTGSDYFGINDNGQVIFRPSDYKLTNIRHQNKQPLFDEQHFFDISESLGNRNLNYSLLDQFIFSCHMYRNFEIDLILKTFPNAKILNTYLNDTSGKELVKFMASLKNCNTNTFTELVLSNKIDHPSVLNIPFGALFDKDLYCKYYDQIIDFLNLNGRLIAFDYVQYYLSKQHPDIQSKLVEYSKTL